MKMKTQTYSSVNKKNLKGQLFKGNTARIQKKNETSNFENRVNPKTLELNNLKMNIISNEINFREITTSPIIIVEY